MFLFDSHNSQLSEPLMNYIRDVEHEWFICFGMPYGTSLWQVGDSKQQTESYKIGVTKYKEKIVQNKLTEFWSNPQFEYYDIIPAVNKAWADSFTHASSNKEAISD